uniref:PDZ domain-containing protein n=1 Tax=Knipowitschia caucasica TaxID=637954 RepID=A0AAV2MPH1_KNICA
MSADLEPVSLCTARLGSGGDGGGGDDGGPAGRALSANVRRLHNSLNVLLDEVEREQFIHCLNVYHAKRNVYDLVQTLRVILSTGAKRQLLPMLRLVIPRSDQLLFDQYTSEGLYLKPELLAVNGTAEGCEEGDDLALQRYVACIQEQSSGCGGGLSFWDWPCLGEVRKVTLTRARSLEGLGFSIRGGAEHGVGIYVSLVEPESFAEREGLRVGDQIVTVNNMMFDGVTHNEAVKPDDEWKEVGWSLIDSVHYGPLLEAGDCLISLWRLSLCRRHISDTEPLSARLVKVNRICEFGAAAFTQAGPTLRHDDSE